MTVEITELLTWHPDYFSEDQVGNFLARVFAKWGRWHLVYYNPPSGSWKSIFLVKGEYEYRQVGPKRGVGQIKRPDLALQISGESDESVNLFLIEAKPKRDEWKPNIVDLLRAYFDGSEESEKSMPVRSIPFSHRRRIETQDWEELKEDNTDTEWFKNSKVDYVFGFAYSIGLVSPEADLSPETDWMTSIMAKLSESPPPLMSIAVGWAEKTYAPLVVIDFTRSFPKSIRTQLESVFASYIHSPRTKSTTLNHFV